MARRIIKFPLIMKDGYEVRTMDELRQHFDLIKMFEYLFDGKLAIWLEQRGYIELLGEVRKLHDLSSHEEILSGLCSSFGLETNGNADIAGILKKIRKLAIVRDNSDELPFSIPLDKIAVSQEELDELISNHAKEQSVIYLAGERFTISDQQPNVTYVGINNPVVELAGMNERFRSAENNIRFANVTLTSISSIYLTDSAEEPGNPFGAVRLDSQKVNVSPGKREIYLDPESRKLFSRSLDGGEPKLLANEFVAQFVAGDDWVFYRPYQKGKCVNKVRSDGSGFAKLLKDESELKLVSYKKGWLFFIGARSCIYRIKADGTDRKQLTGWTKNDCIVTEERIIYQNASDHLYSLKHDGTDPVCLVNRPVSDFKDDGQWLFYASPANGAGFKSDLMKIRLDGSEETIIFSSKKFIYNICLNGEWIIYQGSDERGEFHSIQNGFYKIRRDGRGNFFIDYVIGNKALHEYVAKFTIEDEWIVYTTGSGNQKHKVRLDG